MLDTDEICISQQRDFSSGWDCFPDSFILTCHAEHTELVLRVVARVKTETLGRVPSPIPPRRRNPSPARRLLPPHLFNCFLSCFPLSSNSCTSPSPLPPPPALFSPSCSLLPPFLPCSSSALVADPAGDLQGGGGARPPGEGDGDPEEGEEADAGGEPCKYQLFHSENYVSL